MFTAAAGGKPATDCSRPSHGAGHLPRRRPRGCGAGGHSPAGTTAKRPRAARQHPLHQLRQRQLHHPGIRGRRPRAQPDQHPERSGGDNPPAASTGGALRGAGAAQLRRPADGAELQCRSQALWRNLFERLARSGGEREAAAGAWGGQRHPFRWQQPGLQALAQPGPTRGARPHHYRCAYGPAAAKRAGCLGPNG